MKIRELLSGVSLQEDALNPAVANTPPAQPMIGPNGQAFAAALRNQPGAPYSMDAPIPQNPAAGSPLGGTGSATNVERYVMNKAQMDAARGQPIVAPRLAGQP